MILIRYLLLFIVGFLLIRTVMNYGKSKPAAGPHASKKDDELHNKKVSKEIGEYIDYEEVKKGKS